ncbi:MAG: SGNH/GDSL hydrolase family protein [Candidatus Daviesbacteria bacterium]|nr:SGNH/GDSL hydrolase family protein [Candidatus Daviesbacteria bacterium]
MTPKNIFLLIISFVFFLVLFNWYINQSNQKSIMVLDKNSQGVINYVAVGDSYTIGLGVSEGSRWPNIMTDHLKQQGININLTANPAVSGYTVRDAILELPVVKKIRPDFVTVLIGANDNFSQKEVKEFQQEYKELLDKLHPTLENPKNIVLITIPDYSKSPGSRGLQTQNISKLIEEYNQVIKDEAIKRGLKVADIYPVSQSMIDNDDYISDGLHPSAKGYEKWERVIFPVVFELLKK